MIALEQNNLSPLNYRLKLARTPQLEYRIQSIYIPGMTLGSADIPTPLGIRLPSTGELKYGDLQVSFIVGENMADYLEVFNWMTELGHPDDREQYDEKNAYSDGSVLILNSSMLPCINIHFTRMFPVSLTNLELRSTLTDVQYATATAEFRFLRFYIKPINS